MLNLYTYRDELKSSLLYNWQRLNLNCQTLDWAWLLYAIKVGQTADSDLLSSSITQGLKWIEEEATWLSSGNLGAIGLLCRLLQQEGYPEWEHIAERLNESLQQLQRKELRKFSRLNDPDIVYALVVGASPKLSPDLRDWLQQHCSRNTQIGNYRRRMLFSAVCAELGSAVPSLNLDSSDLPLYELPCALWLAETYADIILEDTRRDLWTALTDAKERILLEPAGDEIALDGIYEISSIDIAMLYLAVESRTRDVDPVALFDSFPLHPKVRQSAQSLFLKGELVNAVLEAAKVLIDEIKHKAGHPTNSRGRPLDGRALIQQVFSTKTPLLKFNALTTQSERDEHEGLKLIAEGIVAAIRNPKGHDPKNKITLAPYEALEQLVVVSYIYKRLDSAQV